MLKVTTEEQRRHIIALCDMRFETCCNFHGELNDDLEYVECDDRIYIDGNITFDKMAEIVDYLRACNPEKK